MAIRKSTSNRFHRIANAGVDETVSLLKREDNQRQGTVRAIKLFHCRRGRITKTGQTLPGDQASDHNTKWIVPGFELKRTGVHWINALDRIVDAQGRYWQPESTTNIEVNALETYYHIDCVRVDP